MRVESLESGASDIVRLRTDGGSSFVFRLSYLDTRRSALPEVGQEIDELFLSEVQAAHDAYGAEAKALELLARAEHNRHLLALKLRKREIPAPAVALALDSLEARGLLSEERYARSWAEGRLRKRGEGPVRIVAGLLARGVDGELARRVVGELLAAGDRQEILRRSALRLLRASRWDEDRTIRRLRSEGWKPSEISVIMKAVCKERD